MFVTDHIGKSQCHSLVTDNLYGFDVNCKSPLCSWACQTFPRLFPTVIQLIIVPAVLDFSGNFVGSKVPSDIS